MKMKGTKLMANSQKLPPNEANPRRPVQKFKNPLFSITWGGGIMNIELKEKPKTSAKKGDFPLEIRVFFNSQGKRYAISSYGGWIETEKALPDELKIFDKSPEKVTLGDDYQRVSIEERDGVTIARYLNITKYD